MKKRKIGKVLALALVMTSMCGIITNAISGYDRKISTGTVKYYDLNKSGTDSARATTDFIQDSKYSSYKSYVFIESVNDKGIRLNSTQGYGGGYGTTYKPDRAECDLTQRGTAKWGSTHRTEFVNDYASLRLFN